MNNKDNNDNKDRKQEILKPILVRFSKILDVIDHEVHNKYKQQLKEKGVASGIQLLSLNKKLSKTAREKTIEDAQKITPWLYPDPEQQKENDAENFKNLERVTAKCPLNQKIVIQYGIDPKLSIFANTHLERDKLPINERFLKVGKLKGKLLPVLTEHVPNKYGPTNMAHSVFSPDEKNAIPFELNEDGIAVIENCTPGRRYYVRIAPITDEEEINKWFTGYTQIIEHLSEFLTSEWDNIHSKRWKIYDEKYQQIEKLNTNNTTGFPLNPHTSVVLGDFIRGIIDEGKQPIIDGLEFSLKYSPTPLGVLNALDLAKAASDKFWEWYHSSEKKEDEQKEAYFFVQDEVYIYIIAAAVEYWYQLQSPKDKAYLAGKAFFHIAVEIVLFIAECYLIGKVIPIAASIIRASSSAISRSAAALRAKGGVSAVETATTEDVILSMPQRFVDFFGSNPKKVALPESTSGGMTEEIVLKEGEINYINNAGINEATMEMGNAVKTESSTVKNLPKEVDGNAIKGETNLDPVSMLTGEELLTLVDDTLFSQFPFVWQRLYRTSAVEFNNGLGYGWSHTLCHSLTFTDDHHIIWQNHENNLITFSLPTESVPAIHNLLSEAAIYLGHEPNHYLVSCESGIYHFVRETAESKQAKLLAISDKYGHQHNVIYDSDGELIGLELSGGV
ncbi:MAG: hypothetical protein J6569_11045, partial [Gilliamella sp.]|uniref:DUF6531 domain-containing protein n=1 Tax=Gilliamella sp. TaxID=1891236 RepID=UPI0025EA9FC6